MELSFKKLGLGEPIIILHGLYGSSDNWMSVGKKLSDKYTVYLIDQRNHGKSAHSDMHNYNVMAEDLREFMNSQSIDKSIILGHSMGGKTAIRFNLKYSESVKRLIVVDIAPKSYNIPYYNSHLSFHSSIIKSLIDLNLPDFTTRQEVFNSLRKSIPNESVRQFLLKNLKRNADKSFYWQLNLSAIKKSLHIIMDNVISDNKEPEPLPNNPVLFIKGENSDYILKEDYPKIQSLFPFSEIVTIHNVGHWLHVDDVHAFINIILENNRNL